MPKISAVIIALNEERYIGTCIESLQGVADEILVVDSHSTDKTEEVCNKFNVRFIRHPFEGYKDQKNWAMNQAANPWVLSLDADEALSPELKESILNVKKSPKFNGYYMNRRNNYCGKWLGHSEWYPNRVLRLFEKSHGKWCGYNIHEKFRMYHGSSTGRLSGDILHWNFETFQEHYDKMEKFSTTAACEYFTSGRKSHFLTPVIHMSWCFIRSYVIGAGFLDGYHGYKISSINAYGCYLKWVKLRDLNGVTNHHHTQ